MICKDCIHNTVCCEKEEDKQALKFCSDYFNLTKELEKIKAEIHDIKLELDCDYYTGDKITRLIEKHIEEMKGETNAVD